jgi:hypothetical protein
MSLAQVDDERRRSTALEPILRRVKIVWIVAVALAVLGNLLYLLIGDGSSFYVLGLLALPLFILLIVRVPVIWGDDHGPWGPPE